MAEVFGVDGFSKTGSTALDRAIGFTDGQGGKGVNFESLAGATREQVDAAVQAAQAAAGLGGGASDTAQAARLAVAQAPFGGSVEQLRSEIEALQGQIGRAQPPELVSYSIGEEGVAGARVRGLGGDIQSMSLSDYMGAKRQYEDLTSRLSSLQSQLTERTAVPEPEFEELAPIPAPVTPMAPTGILADIEQGLLATAPVGRFEQPIVQTPEEVRSMIETRGPAVQEYLEREPFEFPSLLGAAIGTPTERAQEAIMSGRGVPVFSGADVVGAIEPGMRGIGQVYSGQIRPDAYTVGPAGGMVAAPLAQPDLATTQRTEFEQDMPVETTPAYTPDNPPPGYVYDEDLGTFRLATPGAFGATTATFQPQAGQFARLGLLDQPVPSGLLSFGGVGVTPEQFAAANLAFRRRTAPRAEYFTDPRSFTGFSLLT